MPGRNASRGSARTAASTERGSGSPSQPRSPSAIEFLSWVAVTVSVSTRVRLRVRRGRDEAFRTAGLTDPAIAVPAGARVSITVINADPDTADGLVITRSTATSPMPMMTSQPAFAGSALWFLGDPTAAGMHAGTLTFTATRPGSYRYLCPIPGHAQKARTGTLTIS